MRPPGLRSWRLERRVCCSSAVEHPPPIPCSIVACGQSSGNLCLKTPLVEGHLVAGMELFQVATTLLKDHPVDALCEGKVGWVLDVSTSQLTLSRSPDGPTGPVARSVRRMRVPADSDCSTGYRPLPLISAVPTTFPLPVSQHSSSPCPSPEPRTSAA
jgi:hypothetical protein